MPHLGAIVVGLEVADDGDRPSGVDDGAEAPAPTELVVDLRDVAIEYPKRGRAPAFRAVDGVSLTVGHGEVVGLVGESGSGKTTIGRAIVGLLPFVEGTASVLGTDMVGISKEDLRQVRRRRELRVPGSRARRSTRGCPVGESIGEPLLLQKRRQGRRARASGSRSCSTRSTSPATSATATRTSCRAVNASGSASPGRWRSARGC